MSGTTPRRTTRKRANVSGLKRVGAVCAIVAVVAGLASCSQQAASRSTTPSTLPAPIETVMASGVPFPVNLTFDQHGGLWFSSSGGKAPTDGVWYIPPGGKPRQVVSGLESAGLVWLGNDLYVASTNAGTGTITVFSGFNGTSFTSQIVRLNGLTVGQHIIGSIAIGPDGQLYIGVGAAGDMSGSSGSVVSFAPDSGNPVVKATGVRSAFGLAFYGRLLLVTDPGRDDLGPFRPPEKLDEFDPAGPVVNFGYPGCLGQGGPACAGVRPAFATFPCALDTHRGCRQGRRCLCRRERLLVRAESDWERHPTRQSAHRPELSLLALAGQARSGGRHDRSGRRPLRHTRGDRQDRAVPPVIRAQLEEARR